MPEERPVIKFIRDAALTILGGIVIDPTLRRLDFDVSRFLPQIWFGIAAFITIDFIWRNRPIREWSHRFYCSLSREKKVMSYIIVSVLGAGTFSLYWFVATQTLRGPKHTHDSKPAVEIKEQPLTTAPVSTITEPAKSNEKSGQAKQTEQRSAIIVQPTREFSLSSGEWSRLTPISITNSQERSVYGLFVKIWTATPGVLAREISVKPEKTNNPFSLPFGSTSISADVLIFDWLDAENHQSILIRFYELKPHETRRFVVSGKTKMKGTASVRFLKFDEQPPGLLQKENQAAFEFAPPENGKLLGLHIEVGGGS